MKKNRLKSIKNLIIDNKEKIYTIIILAGCVISGLLMYVRCFYGTELTDEAYYVSEAKEMLNGNIPYAINNSAKALGFTFLLIPIVFVYRIFVPDLAGIFLITRLCYTTFRLVSVYIIYRVLKKRIPKYHALLLVGILIPFCTIVQNFSYNTIPLYMTLVSAMLLFDVIEQSKKREKIELFCSGFTVGISCFANPGFGLTLFVFLTLIIRRTKGKNRTKAIVFWGTGIAVEVLIVTLPIIIRTSFADFCYGIYRLYINNIPVDSLAPNKNWFDVIASFKEPTIRILVILLTVSPITYLFSQRYICENGKKLEQKQYLILSVAVPFCLTLLTYAYLGRGSDCTALWGYTTVVYLIVFSLIGTFRNEKFVLYIGMYPVLYSIASIVLVDSDADIGRFAWSFSVVIAIFYVLLKQDSKLVRLCATATIIILLVSIGYADFKFVYRDDSIESLNYKVESGVYKGIYTTEARSKDLPELEEYLNKIIGENDSYAFRDNVPSAYLMMHHGMICEISTWDVMQYTYHRNTPSVIFDYYRRRDMIPSKIIYVDFGRDTNLSIEDPAFKYNDFVEAYYELTEDIKLNETYYHIMVYQYNGTFDGDYDYWFETYYKRD